MDVLKLCRSCMKEVTWKTEHNLKIIQMFTFCTNIQFETEDKLPKQFCDNCSAQIESSYTFIKKAQLVNEALNNLVSGPEGTALYKAIDSDNKDALDIDKLSEKSFADQFDTNSWHNNEIEAGTKHDFVNTQSEPLINISIEFKEDIPRDDEQESEKSFIHNFDATSCHSDNNNETDTKEDELKDKEFVDRQTDKVKEETHKSSDKLKSQKKLCDNCNKSFISKIWLARHVAQCSQKHTKLKKDNIKKDNIDFNNDNRNYKDDVPTGHFDTTSGHSDIINDTEKLSNDLNCDKIKSHDKDKQNKFNDKENTEDTTNHTKKQTQAHKYTCSICNQPFVFKRCLEKHIKVKHKTKKNEKADSKISENETNVRKLRNKGRLKTVYKKEVKYCDLCDRQFTSQLWFSRHMQNEHSVTRTYYCSVCPASFTSYHRLAYHNNLHPELRRFQCETCGKRFRKQKQLAAHRVTHGDARPHPCDKCDMAFKTKSALTEHQKLHEGERPFLCDICGGAFTQSSSLEEHMNRHTGTRPFRCAECPFAASQRCSLSRHMLRHSARTLACPTCNKMFFDKGGLDRHIRTHTGARPYVCPLCARRFQTGWHCKVHMMRAHELGLDQLPAMRKSE